MSYATGDINQDGVVDVIDLSILASQWNTNDELSDLNNDGIVDAIDLSILISNWGSGDESNSIQIVGASANGHDGPNVPANAIDGDPETRWSHDANPSVLELDIGDVQEVGGVRIHQWLGDNNNPAVFDIGISTDGSNWEQVFLGESTGEIDNFETYRHPTVDARYIRYTGYGRHESSWNSITRIEVLTPVSGPRLPLVPPLSLTPGDGQVDILWAPVRPSPATSSWSLLSGPDAQNLSPLVLNTQNTTYLDEGLDNEVERFYRLDANNIDGAAQGAVVSATPTNQPGNGESDPPTADDESWDQARSAALAQSSIEPLREWHEARAGFLGNPASLTGQSGTINTTHDGQLIENLDLTGRLNINHENVIIRNCIFRPSSETSYRSVWISAAGALFENVTFDGGTGNQFYPSVFWGCTLRGVLIRAHRSGIRMGSNLTVEDSMVESLYHWQDSHNAGASTAGNVSNINFHRVWLVRGSSSGLSLYPDTGTVTNNSFDRLAIASGDPQGFTAAYLAYTDSKVYGPYTDNIGFTNSVVESGSVAWASYGGRSADLTGSVRIDGSSL